MKKFWVKKLCINTLLSNFFFISVFLNFSYSEASILLARNSQAEEDQYIDKIIKRFKMPEDFNHQVSQAKQQNFLNTGKIKYLDNQYFNQWFRCNTNVNSKPEDQIALVNTNPVIDNYSNLSNVYGIKPKKLKEIFQNMTSNDVTVIRSVPLVISGNIKMYFVRNRPDTTDCFGSDLRDPSFPSMHTTIARYLALFLYFSIDERNQTDIISKGMDVGINRVRSHNHHPSDVIAGEYLADLLFCEKFYSLTGSSSKEGCESLIHTLPSIEKTYFPTFISEI